MAATGVACALGLDAPSAMAAARAGLSRASVQRHFKQRSEVEGRPEDVTGHAVDLLTRGFERQARLLRLAQAALADLLQPGADTPPWQRRASFHLALAPAARHTTGMPLRGPGADPDDEPPAADDAAGHPSPHEAAQRADADARRLLARALAAARWPGEPGALTVHAQGHAAGLEALAAATAALASGPHEAAVVLAVDSLLDEDSLQWLSSRGRLKCDAQPAGVQPGEAAVAVALTRSQAGPGLRVARVVLGEEPLDFLGGHASSGQAQAELLAQAWGDRGGDAAWLFSDHNGEHHRAAELGGALARLRGFGDRFSAPQLWYPALSFGDTAAVAAPLAVAMALHARQRRCAPSDAALVCAASDGPQRAAALLELV